MISLFVILGVLLAGLVLWLFMQNRSATVECKKTIHAPIQKVFQEVVDFKNAKEWYPWIKYEPKARISLSQKTDAVGSFYQWAGKWIGSGKLTNKNISLHASVEQELEFIKPWKSKSVVRWHFAEEKGQTEVTWAMEWKVPFFLGFLAPKIAKNLEMDLGMGLDFLAMRLDPNFPPYSIKFIGESRTESILSLSMPFHTHVSEISASCQKACVAMESYIEKEKLGLNRFFIRYNKTDTKTMNMEYDVCYAIKHSPKNPLPEGVYLTKIPSFHFVKTLFIGDYKYFNKAWHGAMTFSKMAFKNRIAFQKPGYEFYLTDPIETAPKDYQTEIWLTLKK